MITNLTIPAQNARPTIRVVHKRALPNKDEIRPWWNLVDDDKVSMTISDDLFQAYVRLITAIA